MQAINPLDERLLERLGKATPAAALITLVIAMLVSIGWLWDIPQLASFLPDAPPMRPRTVLGIALASFATLLLRQPRDRWRQRGGSALALATGLLAVLALIELAIGQPLLPDHALYQRALRRPVDLTEFVMPPQACVALLFISAALLSLGWPRNSKVNLGRWLSLAPLLLGFSAMLGYLYDAPGLYSLGQQPALAFSSALAVFTLAAGILLARPAAAPTALLGTANVGGYLARRLLPAALLLPVLFEFLRLRLEDQGVVSPGLGEALSTLANCVLFLLLIGWVAWRLANVDAQRYAFEQALRRDLEERTRTEEALRVSERQYRELAMRLEHERGKLTAILENLPVGVGFGNPVDMTFSMNKAGLALHGFTSAQDMLHRLDEYLEAFELRYPDGRLMPTDEWPAARALRGEYVRGYEARLCNKRDACERIVSYSVAPVADDDSSPPTLVYVIQDLTERKRAEAELRLLKDELELRVEQRTAELALANRELEAFSYTVSHDLRAPLRHISGFIRLLEKHAAAQFDDKARRYARLIDDAAQRMGALIDDLLALSRVGRVTIAASAVSLRQLVDSALQELAPALHGRTIEWRIGALPEVRGDPNLLRVVMVNLLSNAIKYTLPRDPARIEIGAEENADEVICYVRDNGVGFDMQFADKLFGVFQRLHGSDEFEGTGIGLASVRRIIQRHGGRTWAVAAVDEGATFYFALPKHRSTAS